MVIACCNFVSTVRARQATAHMHVIEHEVSELRSSYFSGFASNCSKSHGDGTFPGKLGKIKLKRVQKLRVRRRVKIGNLQRDFG